MRRFILAVLILLLATLACQSVAPGAPPPALTHASTTQPEMVAASATSPTHLPTLAATATPSAVPAGVIRVDTLDQEVYPFIENGKCSLAEAIFAANAGKPQDSCAAGEAGNSVIELMPGEYHFTQRDQTPPQAEWFVNLRSVGSALPPMISPLTIHGNQAVLIRDEDAEPFRFFELAVNARLALDNLTLQGGDAGEDWGGAIYATNAPLDLKDVRMVDNRARDGGALWFQLSALNIQDSEFTGNHSTNNGGAIFIDSSRADIQSTRFDSNEADGEGGGLWAYTANLTLTDDFFIKNRITGKGSGTYGGAVHADHVNATITGNQFYQNEAPLYGGAIAVGNGVVAGNDSDPEGEPIQQLQQSPMVSDMLTNIPGFQATLEAHPSGVFVAFHEATEIHNNCFANNHTDNPSRPNWSSGLSSLGASADGNYWGSPSGPSGKGPGNGDSVGKRVTFAPFLTAAPSFCDPTLAERK